MNLMGAIDGYYYPCYYPKCNYFIKGVIHEF